MDAVVATLDQRQAWSLLDDALSLALGRVRRRLSDLALGGSAQDTFLALFGSAGTDPDVFQARLATLLADLAQGAATLPPVDLRGGAELNGARAVYVAPLDALGDLILLNADALLALGREAWAAELERLLLEESGHSFDRLLNGERDSRGDEGEAFALRVLGVTADAASAERISAEDDSTLLWLDGRWRSAERAAPVLSDTVLTISLNEDAGNPVGAVGTLVSSLVGGVSDPDSGALKGLAIVAANQTNGTWWFTINGGTTWSQLGAVSTSSALLLAADTLTRVWFAPKANWNGSVSDGLTVRAWDRTSGSNGARRSLNNSYYVYDNFSTTLYTNNTLDSSETATQRTWASGWSRSTSYYIRIDGGALVVRGIGSGTENFSRSVDLSGATAATLSFAWLTTSAETDDSFQVQSRSSSTDTWANLGVFTTISNGVWRQGSVTISGGDLTNTAQIRFITVDSGDFASWGDRFAIDNIKIRWTGDISVSSASDTVAVAVAPVNDAPQLVIPIPSQAASQDSAFSFTLPAGSFVDPDNQTLTYSASLTSGAALPSWLSFNPSTRTFSGTPRNSDVGTLNVRVTASDGLASTSSSFTLSIANRNDGPIVAVPIPDQTASEDQPFSFVVPAGSFTDIDPGTVLTYSASLASGAPLPGWLSFNPSTRSFSGTPRNADVGVLNLRVTASDGEASVSDVFSLSVANVNDPPFVAKPIADLTTLESQTFVYSVPQGTFGDEDAGTDLTLQARLVGGAALPGWLRFEAAIDTFIGQPDDQDLGDWMIELIASDGQATASTTFRLRVENVNDFPFLNVPLLDQEARELTAFSFTLPPDSFLDPDVGTSLLYSASRADGSSLPGWLSFDAGTRRFSGTPSRRDVGDVEIRLTASDPLGASASGFFTLRVVNLPTGRSIEKVGNTELLAYPDGSYAARPTEIESAPELIRYEGSLLIEEVLGPDWQLKGAESVEGQNRLLWRNQLSGRFTLWDADPDWNWSASGPDLEPDSVEAWQIEQDFGQDFNADGVVGAPLSSLDGIGNANLLVGRNQYWIRVGKTLKPLTFRGAPARPDPVAGLGPMAAETIGGINRVLVADKGGKFCVWSADANWNGERESQLFLPATDTGWGWELGFNLDLDRDGVIGNPFEVLENRGAIRLQLRNGTFSVRENELTVPLSRAGLDLTLSSGFGELPIAAEVFSNVKQLLVRRLADNLLSFWRMDDEWNYQTTVGLVDPVLGQGQKLEARFGADVDNNGIVRRLRQSGSKVDRLTGTGLDEYLIPTGTVAVPVVSSLGGKDLIAVAENGINRWAAQGTADRLIVNDFDPDNDQLVVLASRSYVVAPLTLDSVSGTGFYEDRNRDGLLDGGDELLAQLAGFSPEQFVPEKHLLPF